MLPEEWKSGRVSDFFILQRGFDLTKAQAIAGNTPVFTSSGCSYTHNEPKVKAPGIVTGRKGSVGAVHLVTADFWPHDTTLWVNDFKGNDVYFVKYFLDSLNLSRFDEASAVPTLNRNTVHVRKCVFPPLSEQIKIVQILSTWDQAIATTEKLIDNSQTQKKALMQQLLTGEKRLPGFGEKWQEYKLNAVAKIIVSPVDKKIKVGELPVQLCNYTDVYYNTKLTNTLRYMEATATQSEIDRFTLQPGDVVITKDSETAGDIAVPALVGEDLKGIVCGYHLAIVRPKKSFSHGSYLNYMFSQPKVRYYFFTLATGATRFGLPVAGINEAVFHLPSPEEQKAIANILETCDMEIDNFSKQLNNLKAQKKALMQQLLTGKRRVVVEGQSA